MDKTGSVFPDVIPKPLLQSAISIVECESGNYSWTLTRTNAGFSLLIKSNSASVNSVAANGKKHNARRSRGSDNVNNTILEKDSVKDSASINIHARPKKTKTKSPSAISRDKARRKRYRLRKRELRAAKKNIALNSLNSVLQEVENYNCEPEPRASVEETLETHISSELKLNLPAESCDKLRLEECVPVNTTEIDSDADSNFSEQACNIIVNKCVHCKKEFHQTNFINCPKCNLQSYCSKECQETDWKKWHKFICKP